MSQDHLEMMVRGITGEPFIAEHIILLDGNVPLCDDPRLRMAVLTTLPMLDDMGVAARQLGGDPGRGVWISEARAVPTSQEAQSASSGERRHRLQRGDRSFVGEPASKRQRTGDPGQSSSRSHPPGGVPQSCGSCVATSPAFSDATTTGGAP